MVILTCYVFVKTDYYIFLHYRICFIYLQYYSVQILITVLNPWNLEPTLAKDVLNDKSSLVRRYVPVGPQYLR